MTLYPLLEMLMAPVLLGFYNAYLILDDRTPEEDTSNRRLEFIWHLAGGAIFCYFAWLYAGKYGYGAVLYTLANFWLFFAGIVHKVALKKPFFFVGTTAMTDKSIRWISAFWNSLTGRWEFTGRLSLSVELTSAVLKILAYFAAAGLYLTLSV